MSGTSGRWQVRVIRRCLVAAFLATLVCASPALASFEPVVISQFRAQGIASTDFIQLKNISSGPATLASGWSLTEINNDNALDEHSCGEVNNGPTLTLGPGQDYLVGGGGTGTGAPDQALANSPCGGGFTSAFPTVNGELELNASTGSDTVGYGNLSGEGTALSGPATGGQSDQRKNGGTQETGDNATDFQAVTANLVDRGASIPVPGVTTTAGTNVAATTATFNGTYNGYDTTAISCSFMYGTSITYGSSIPCSTSSTAADGTVTVSANVTGLSGSTGYHYQLQVTTAAGTTVGGDQTFTTPTANSAPTVTTGSSSGVGYRTATLAGTVNPEGAALSACHFQYGTDTSYGSSVNCSNTPTDSGFNPESVSAFVNDISGLSPNTKYHYRFVATNSFGTTDGSDATFTTGNAPASDGDSIVISQFSVGGGNGAFVELMNVSASNQTLPSNWSLLDIRSDGNADCVVASGESQVTLAPGQTLLLTQSGWTGTGTKASDRTFTGCTTLFSSGVLEGTDSVGYGTLTNGTAGSGTPFTPAPTSGQAAQRLYGGTLDDGSDIDDFQVVTPNPMDSNATAPVPTGSTDTATNVGATSATLNGTVNPRGGNVTDCHFKFGTDTSYTMPSVPCSSTPSGTSSVAVAANVTSLANSTQYHYQLVVTTAAGTLTANDQTLTTTAANAFPTGSTGAASAIGSNTATLNGTANPHGASVSDCHFDYGTSTSYGASVPCATTPSGLNDTAVPTFVSNLTPNTTYHYRLDVTTTNPPSFTGADQTFTTNALGHPDGDKIVISQFRTQGVANGDFIELMNISSGLVTLSGWHITNLSGDGNSACSVITAGPTTALGPGQALLLTQSGWTGSGAQAGDMTFNGNCGTLDATAGVLEFSGTMQSGGQSASGVDYVGYGTLTNQTPPAGTPVTPVPNDGTSLQRRSGGTQDTASDIDDFADVSTAPEDYFATVPPPAPTVSAPTSVTTNAATLEGTAVIYQSPSAACQWEWGTSTSFGHTVPCTVTPQGVFTNESVVITGLTPDTTYYYRLDVSDPSGTISSSPETFGTLGPPTGTTGDASGVGATVATLAGIANIHSGSSPSCEFQYGTIQGSHPNSVACSPAPTGFTDTPVNASLTGLTPSTTYYYVVSVTTSGEPTATGLEKHFTTNPAATESTDSATGITATTATLNGTANPEGDSVSDCHFDLGTSTSYGTSIPCPSSPSGTSPTAISAAASALAPLTSYHYRLVVTTSGGTLTGTDQQFTTLPLAPTGSTDAASGVGQTVATLNGTVNPQGGTVSDCHFDYGTSTSYGGVVACASTPSGSSPAGVSASLTGLTESSAYHYRLVVTTAGGTLTGDDQTFTTTAKPLPGAPTRVSAIAGNGEATISFLAPVPNGSPPVTSYTVTASPGGAHASGASSPIKVAGLTNGTSYTFTVVATNINGDGPASAPSGPVKPTALAQAPRLAGLTIVPARLTPASTNLPTIDPTSPKGTGATIGYTDSQAAITAFTVSRAVPGHRNSHGTCVIGSPGRGKHHAPACTAHQTIGAFTHADQPGSNRLHFTGRLNHRALPAGAYTLSAIATNPAGMRSGAVTATFRVS